MPAAIIDTVIFDVGGVLAETGRHGDIARRFPTEVAEQVMRVILGDYGDDGDHPWHRLERGEITLSENHELNRAALLAAGIELPIQPPGVRRSPGSPGTPRMIEFTPCAAMVALVEELRGAGFRLGVLTNNVAEFREGWRAMLPFDEWFDDVVDSHEVGLRKPNPAIYQLALARLGAAAERTAFLDDVATNVSAAERVGIRAVLVEPDPAGAIATVRRWAGFID